MFLLSDILSDILFLISWAIDPCRDVVILINEGVGINFASSLFESSLAFLEVRSEVLGTNNGDENDKGSYDTNKDTLDLNDEQNKG